MLALNEELSVCAKRKKLRRARELFDNARASGLAPDAHSWTNLVNCLARCGRPEEASQAVAEMRAAGVAPNVVTYTALVKALCAAGDVGGAAAAVRAAEADGTAVARPNARMGSALLRGCVRVGAVKLGESTLAAYWSRWGCQPDSAAFEAVATLLGQALRPKAIAALLAHVDAAANGDPSSIWGDNSAVTLPPATRAAMHLAAARAFALKGKWNAASEQRAALETALETPDAPAEAREGAAHIDASSVDEFARHRRAELQRDSALIGAFVAKRVAADVLGGLTRRVSSFVEPPTPPPGEEEEDDKEAEQRSGLKGKGPWCARLASNLWDTFGLGAAAKQLGARREDVEANLACRMDADGRLIHPKAGGKNGKQGRLIIELCSGSGEWVCAQAAAAPNDRFVAVELRADRGYNIFARTLLEGVSNVEVVVGDAREVVSKRLALHSAHAICINHPEPPEWAGGGDDSDGAHLLDAAFLNDCRELLRPGGTLAIVTDNRRYGRTLAETLGGIGGFADLAEPSNPPAVRPGLPPPACGYEDQEASSFFDRLWANGKKTKRYHLGVSRVATSGE